MVPTLTKIDPGQDRAILLGLEVPADDIPIEESLDELAALAEAAGVGVAGQLTQRRAAADATFFVGRGKAEEAAQFAASRQASVILVDNDLTPAQARNLERLCERRVLDRTELILDLFAIHAQTHQARVQVALAQMEYALPRLKRLWTHLHRERGAVHTAGGGSGGGGGAIGGAGERQIELDRRLIRTKIRDLKRELASIRRRKVRRVASRAELCTVALVGYTNAGKSTLFNALTDAGVLVADRLFATLDTRTRIWRLGGHYRALLSDTVGFVRKLPHHLIEAFHATLEEARTADLLLHVVDASLLEPERQIEAVNQVLRTLDCQKTRTLLVFNKIDALVRRGDLFALANLFHDSVAISAHTGEGLDQLAARVSEILAEREIELEVPVAAKNGKLLAFLTREGRVLQRQYSDDHETVTVRVRLEPRFVKKLERLRDRDRQFRDLRIRSAGAADAAALDEIALAYDYDLFTGAPLSIAEQLRREWSGRASRVAREDDREPPGPGAADEDGAGPDRETA